MIFERFFYFLQPAFGHGRLGHPQSLEYLFNFYIFQTVFHFDIIVFHSYCSEVIFFLHISSSGFEIQLILGWEVGFNPLGSWSPLPLTTQLSSLHDMG